MPNPQRGEYLLSVGEGEQKKQYIMAFDSNAICELEDALGSSLTAMTKRWKRDELAYKDIRAMLWASLRARHPQITLQQAGQLMDAAGLQIVTDLVMKAFNGAFPVPGKGSADEKKAEATGAGQQP